MFTSCDKHTDESEGLYTYDNCDLVTTKTDEGTNQTYSITKEIEGIKFTKVTNNNYDSFYIEVKVYPQALKNPGKGVVLLLQDGKTIKRLNQKIELKSNGTSKLKPNQAEMKLRTAYSAIFQLSQAEIKWIKESRITDKLVGDKYHEKVYNGFEIIDYFRCLTK
jgi:hypothetical protein